jgi:HEAT repeat protein
MIDKSIVKIEEIIDDMTQALANLAKVNNQKTKMLEIIRASDDAKTFEEFTKATDDDIKNNAEQYKTLLSHRDTLAALKKKYDESDEHDRDLIVSVVTDIFTAFNVISDATTEA